MRLNRRSFFGAVAGGAVASLAGCVSIGSEPGNIQWKWQTEVLAGQGLQPVAFVTGTAQNTGGTSVSKFTLTCTLKDSGGGTIATKTETLDRIAPDDTEYFHWRFALSSGQAKALKSAEVTGSYPD